MLALTRRVDYALVALAGLAEHADRGGDPVSARELAAAYDLPLQMLVKILKDLQRHGLIDSVRGARGGYVLRHRPAWVTLTSVIEAMEGPVSLTPCCDDAAEPTDATSHGEPAGCESGCRLTARCPIMARVRQLNERVQSFFDQVTLRDLMPSDPGAGPQSGLNTTPVRLDVDASRSAASGSSQPVDTGPDATGHDSVAPRSKE